MRTVSDRAHRSRQASDEASCAAAGAGAGESGHPGANLIPYPTSAKKDDPCLILIFGGFMSAPSGKPRKNGLAYWLPTTLTLVIGLAVLRDPRERSQPERTRLRTSGSSRARSRLLTLVSCLPNSEASSRARTWPAPTGSATSGSHHLTRFGRCRQHPPAVKMERGVSASPFT